MDATASQPTAAEPSAQPHTDGPGVAVHRPAGSARGTWAMGSLFEHLLSGSESGGRIGVALITQPPGVATPLHRHTREAEMFFMLDGTLTYRAGDEVFHLAAGDLIWLPVGLPHAFRVTGDTPARLLAVTDPGGLLELYDEVGLPATERRLPGADGRPLPEEVARWNEVGPRYGLQVVGPPIP